MKSTDHVQSSLRFHDYESKLGVATVLQILQDADMDEISARRQLEAAFGDNDDDDDDVFEQDKKPKRPRRSTTTRKYAEYDNNDENESPRRSNVRLGTPAF